MFPMDESNSLRLLFVLQTLFSVGFISVLVSAAAELAPPAGEDEVGFQLRETQWKCVSEL